MIDILIVTDMQNDFIDGALGSKEAVAILPAVIEKVKTFSGKVIFTRDTHHGNYMETQEGHNLPVPHCIDGSHGWEIHDSLKKYAGEIIDKPSFGSLELVRRLIALNDEEPIKSITVIGLCTDICVISNAMLAKNALPEVPIYVDAKCSAGVTPESHQRALDAMKPCQIHIINE